VLSEQSIEHVVLERGEVANTWKTERWDSLRLLTPNWLTRLPGLAYEGEDPDGFMAVAELVEFLERYQHTVRGGRQLRRVRSDRSSTCVALTHGDRSRCQPADGVHAEGTIDVGEHDS